MAKSDSTEVIAPLPGQKVQTEQLAALTSFDDALKLAAELVGEENILRADQEIGDGFGILKNKDSLIETPLIFISWDFNVGDQGEYVSVKVMTKEGRKFILNDGSTGIYAQLVAYTAKKKVCGGLLVGKGLRRSDYTFTNEKGEETPATTYYIDTSS